MRILNLKQTESFPLDSNLSLHRPTWVEINHKNLKENFFQLSRLVSPKVSILSVVKANGYGHGLVPVAKSLSECGSSFFGVTSLEEALTLKEAHLNAPILILGNIFPNSSLEPAIKNGIRITVASIESARACEEMAIKCGLRALVHAKLDTGMNRIGVNIKNGLDFIQKILEHPSLKLEGIYTHFSGSAEDPKFTKFQIETFTNFISLLSQKKIYAPYVHCANSAALIKYPESRFSLVRPGISLYGINPFQGEKKLKLKKVLSWKSRIVFLKEAPAKTRISYLGTFVTKRASKIATAAFGYADGYRRSLSNKGVVLVNGKRVPVIGRVTMDMTMLDVTECPKVHVGDEVVLIGEQGKETISVEEMAELCQTSAYEIFCNIAARVARVDLV